ncbi:MAG: CoA transferase, partial [Pseudomonadota bacterium]|nr:CoA transferase [Pseudomonadota bacterium]
MLEGIKVIEMATYIAAPAAGGVMADWGAEV